MQTKKILITGGEGFFGSRFRKYYSQKYEVFSTDKDDTDITDKTAVKELITNIKPDIIFHTAAIPVTNFCNENPDIAYAVNVNGAINVAEAANLVGSRLVFISTEQVFNGNSEKGPFSETDIPNPNTVYGENKLEAEGLLKNIIEDLWIFRFTWLFGLPERNCNINPNILWNTILNLFKNQKFEVSDNEFRGYTCVYEIIEQFPELVNLPYGTYHLGCRNDESRYEISRKIAYMLGGTEAEKLVGRKHGNYRDVRLDTKKVGLAGIDFPGSMTSIINCLKEFRYLK